jgi:hypothetical protein
LELFLDFVSEISVNVFVVGAALYYIDRRVRKEADDESREELTRTVAQTVTVAFDRYKEIQSHEAAILEDLRRAQWKYGQYDVHISIRPFNPQFQGYLEAEITVSYDMIAVAGRLFPLGGRILVTSSEDDFRKAMNDDGVRFAWLCRGLTDMRQLTGRTNLLSAYITKDGNPGQHVGIPGISATSIEWEIDNPTGTQVDKAKFHMHLKAPLCGARNFLFYSIDKYAQGLKIHVDCSHMVGIAEVVPLASADGKIVKTNYSKAVTFESLATSPVAPNAGLTVIWTS